MLVASGRLGGINRLLLSPEAAAARGMRLAGVAMNFAPGADPRVVADALARTLRG